MATSNEEKYLKSIDTTLKDILKELKGTKEIKLDQKSFNFSMERYQKAQKAMERYEVR